MLQIFFVYLVLGECFATHGYHNTHLQLAMSRGAQCHVNDYTPNMIYKLLLSRYVDRLAPSLFLEFRVTGWAKRQTCFPCWKKLQNAREPSDNANRKTARIHIVTVWRWNLASGKHEQLKPHLNTLRLERPRFFVYSILAFNFWTASFLNETLKTIFLLYCFPICQFNCWL